MSDVRIRDFAERAEQVVELPDLGRLAERGRRRRQRRTTAVAGLVAAVVAVAGSYVLTVDREPDVDPVDDTATGGATPYPGNSNVPKLTAGTYEIKLYREGFPAKARFTVPSGWRGWYGPNMPYMQQGYVGLLVGDVDEVAERVCVEPVSDMRPVGDSPEELVEALSELPRHPVVRGPSRKTFAGLPATHLVLRGARDAWCPSGGKLEVWDSPGGGGLVSSPGPGALMYLWVVDIGREAALVSAMIGPGTPQWAADELGTMVESVEFVESQD